MSTTDDGLPILDSVQALARMLVSNEDLADGTITQVEYDRQNRRFVASAGQEYADALTAIALVEHWSPADMGRQARAGLAALTALDARIRYVVTGPTTERLTFTIAVDVDRAVWAQTYGLDLDAVTADAGPHLRETIREAVTEQLHRMASGAEVVAVGEAR